LDTLQAGAILTRDGRKAKVDEVLMVMVLISAKWESDM
jgi:hypothetical protein